MPEAVLFLYCLVDHSRGEQGEVKDCLWLSEAERDRRQAELSESNLVWERDNEATPRWDVSYLLMAVCSFHAAANIVGFGEAIGCNLPEDSPTLQLLYQQYSDAVAKLAYVKPAIVQAVAIAYHQMQRVNTEELITNEADVIRQQHRWEEISHL